MCKTAEYVCAQFSATRGQFTIGFTHGDLAELDCQLSYTVTLVRRTGQELHQVAATVSS